MGDPVNGMGELTVETPGTSQSHFSPQEEVSGASTVDRPVDPSSPLGDGSGAQLSFEFP